MYHNILIQVLITSVVVLKQVLFNVQTNTDAINSGLRWQVVVLRKAKLSVYAGSTFLHVGIYKFVSQ